MYEKRKRRKKKRSLMPLPLSRTHTHIHLISYNSPSIYIIYIIYIYIYFFFLISYCFVRFISLFASFGHDFKYSSSSRPSDSHKLHHYCPLLISSSSHTPRIPFTQHTLTHRCVTRDKTAVLDRSLVIDL